MKLVGELKKQVEETNSKEEAKEIMKKQVWNLPMMN